MNSRITDDFRQLFGQLPEAVRETARKNYTFWKQNPSHPSLQFKRVHAIEPIYSVRVGLGWRVLGLFEDDAMTWFWIGSHADYDKLLKRLKRVR